METNLAKILEPSLSICVSRWNVNQIAMMEEYWLLDESKHYDIPAIGHVQPNGNSLL